MFCWRRPHRASGPQAPTSGWAKVSLRSHSSRPDETGNRGETMHRIITVSIAASLATLSLGGAAFAQQAPQSPNMTFFVASSGPGKGGDLGGIDAADARCQSLATAAGAGSKVWRAYLSSTPNG